MKYDAEHTRIIFNNFLQLHNRNNYIRFYKDYFKYATQMCTSVNIRAVRAPAVLNCPRTNLRPSSCPIPRTTGALFWVWPHRKTWLTPWLVQLDLFCHLVWWSPRGCGGDPALCHQPLLRAGDGRMAHASTAATLISWLIVVHGSLIIVFGVVVV